MADATESRLGRYFNNDTFSDFTIVCAGREFKVHRVIISSHSKFFETCCDGRFAETDARCVELKEDHPDAVAAMIKYCYSLDYSDVAHPDQPHTADNAMQLNARVYAVADKYGIPELKKLALEKFKQSVAMYWTNDMAIVKAAETVYNEIELADGEQALK